MMNITYIVLLFSLSQTATELYNQGNRYYTQSDFHEAIWLYEEASHQVTSALLYYNLGNAYFKAGKIGKAIINFRRARFLSPRDPDIEHNLVYVRNYRVDKARSSSSPITTLLAAVFKSLSMREAQVTATCFFVIMSIFMSLYIIKRKNIFGYAAIAGGVLFVLTFISWQVWINERNARSAVIIVPEVNAMSGPGDEYKHILVLHDGAEVRIREARQDYVLIQLPGGLGGWIDKGSLEEVF
jgi:tetratricopeptide (TPR) repeat protein